MWEKLKIARGATKKGLRNLALMRLRGTLGVFPFHDVM